LKSGKNRFPDIKQRWTDTPQPGLFDNAHRLETSSTILLDTRIAVAQELSVPCSGATYSDIVNIRD
jgi:hypothetical protein